MDLNLRSNFCLGAVSFSDFFNVGSSTSVKNTLTFKKDGFLTQITYKITNGDELPVTGTFSTGSSFTCTTIKTKTPLTSFTLTNSLGSPTFSLSDNEQCTLAVLSKSAPMDFSLN